jgi:hypothetical protein
VIAETAQNRSEFIFAAVRHWKLTLGLRIRAIIRAASTQTICQTPPQLNSISPIGFNWEKKLFVPKTKLCYFRCLSSMAIAIRRSLKIVGKKFSILKVAIVT